MLTVDRLSGDGFDGISMELPAGLIVGLAGIEGQGQRAFLRALAGLQSASPPR